MARKRREALPDSPPATPKHWDGTDGANDVSTLDFERAMTRAGEAIDEYGLLALLGAPGLGKTFVVKSVAERLAIPFHYLECPPFLRGRHQTITMLIALRWPHDPRDSPRELLVALVAACEKQHQVLALDEVDRWGSDGVELIRYLWSQPANQTAFIFVGSKVAKLIAANPALDSRLERRVTFEVLDVEQAKAAMRAYHPVFNVEDADADLLVRAHRLTGGKFRRMAQLLKQILIEAGEPKPKLTRQLLDSAWDATGLGAA